MGEGSSDSRCVGRTVAAGNEVGERRQKTIVVTYISQHSDAMYVHGTLARACSSSRPHYTAEKSHI